MRICFVNLYPARANGNEMYDVAAAEALLNSYASPGTQVDIKFPDDFDGSAVFSKLSALGNLNGLHHLMNAPSIVRKILWAAENGYDAVISSNTFDPGVDGGRLAVDIPVIGLLRCAIHAAAVLADRIGVLVPLASHVPYTRRLLRTYGMEQFVADVRAIGVYGDDLAERKGDITDQAAELIRNMTANGAEIIVPLGGILIPYVVDPQDLERRTGVQVLNTKAIGIRFAETCVAFKMAQSGITYPRAPIKASDAIGRQ